MTDESTEPQVPQTCALMLAPHDTLNRILVVRSVDGYATHWMDHYGAWQALPETVEGMQELMVRLDESPELLPQIDMSYVDVVDEPEADGPFDQVPFGD